jgi:amino acid transporter
MLITFILVLLFFMGPLTDEVMGSSLPIIYVIYNATGSRTAANALVSLIAVLIFFAFFNMFASVSRLIWVFARDNGLPFSRQLSYVCALAPAVAVPPG